MSTQPGSKKKRFLAPQEKFEIWMQLVRGETTIGEAAARARVDRSTIAKLREVARQGRWMLWLGLGRVAGSLAEGKGPWG